MLFMPGTDIPDELKGRRSGRNAALVAAGITLSRLAGLLRDRALAYYFGLSAPLDALRAALRIPNFLQNLFGEGALSASFIPVYSGLLGQGKHEEADRVAGAVFALLSLLVSALVLGGVLTTSYFITVFAGGLQGQTRELAIQLTRILFPGIGLLVMSAWCLGVLNSHRKFFMSYAAPVAWNAVIIATLIIFGRRPAPFPLAIAVAWGSVAGSALQFAVQMPLVLRLAKGLRLSLGRGSSSVRDVIRNFGPVFFSRGVVQISAWIDTQFASYLTTGALAALSNAQTLYLLPVSLFGMSVSAAELPEMSRATGNEADVATALCSRLTVGLRRIAFFVVPSAMAFLAMGDVVAGAIYQTGRFGRPETLFVWGILAGSAVGLLASTLGRLYTSAFYALRDTRTPLKYAILRVVLTTGLGYWMAFHLPGLLGLEPRWGTAGLTASAGLAGWVEFVLLRRALNRRIGRTGLSASFLAVLWTAAAAGAAAGWAVKGLMGTGHPIFLALGALGLFGTVYLSLTYCFGLVEARNFFNRIKR
jgi:putative peptidoglycan lipid II flippase